MPKGYVIVVGHSEPEEVIVSKPNENNEPGPNAKKILHIPGQHMLVNMARVWARRVLSDGKPLTDDKQNEIPLEFTNPKYGGRLEFLKWMENKPGAQQIAIRYLPQSQSLDVEYQDNIQKVKIDLEGRDDSGFIELLAGQNKFDEEKNPLFTQFLKVHPQNKNSVSKNDSPRIQGFTYYELTDEAVDQTEIKKFESKMTGGLFITGISTNDQSLRNLLDLLKTSGVDFETVNHLSQPLDIYKALIRYSESEPELFNQAIDAYKRMVSDCFVKAESYKALDLTKNGFIAMIIDNKSEVIYEVPEGKGKQMLDWVLENFITPAVYEKTKRLKELCDTKLN